MLIQTRGDQARYITQHDHGIHTGELAHAWDVPLTMEAVLANALHDMAWIELDDPTRDGAPFCSERGRLHDFNTLPKDLKMELYTGGLDRLEALHPYVGLLISVHYSVFFKRDDASASYHATEDARRARLGARLAIDESDARLQRDYAWLKFFDVVSLYACLSQPGADPENLPFWLRSTYHVEGRDYAFEWLDEDTLVIDPFDAHAPVVTTIPYRTLPLSFENPQQLASAWQAAPVESWRLTIRGR